MKKTFLAAVVCSVFGLFSIPVLAEAGSSAMIANRRTAIRYLQLAKQYASEKAWKDAEAQAEIGLAYDDTIADLWYINAVTKSMLGSSRAKVLPLVVKALNDAEWVDYNRDGARILYADILCSTGLYTEAVSVLDGAPFLYSADAEYLRVKAFYNVGDEEHIEKAREKIDAARRIYPKDVRFARLFFAHEYLLQKSCLYAPEGAEVVMNPLVRKLADAFILQLSHYADADAELELYAAIFAEGKQKTRMLNSFKARGLKAPLYAETALRAGLVSEDEALDRFFEFADREIDLSVLEAFVPLVTTEAAKKDLAEYLTAYDGIIVSDTDGDLETNLSVVYARGRPVTVSYDETQDGENDWTCDCDFGVPVVVHLSEGALDVQYTTWPWVQKALYLDSADEPVLEFNLVGETLSWTPFTMPVLDSVKNALSLDLFYPSVPEKLQQVSARTLLLASTSYELPSKERTGARIRVSLLDGVPQLARYYTKDGRLYAQAHFDGGLPALRTVDTDGDGLFETTETYGYAGPGEDQDYISTADEMQIMTNLFGAPSSGTGFYVRMIQVDQNGDTIPDFTEEYLPGEGKIASWDTDGDGLWDIRYVKQPLEADGRLREEAYFHQPLTESVVCVKSTDGVPVSVSNGEETLPVTKSDGVYWLGDAGSKKAAEKIRSAVNQTAFQGVSLIVEDEGERMLAVRAGNMIFGEKLPPAADNNEADSKTKNLENRNVR